MTKEVIKKVDEKTFYRNALIYLAANRNTPENIFNARFDKPKIKYFYALKMKCNCVVKYSLEIEKEVKYKKNVKEEYYDVKTQKIKTKISDRDVVETSWEPHSNSYEMVCSASAILDSEFDKKLNNKVSGFIDAIGSKNLSSGLDDSMEEDYAQETKAVEKECLETARKSYNSFIKCGHYKNFEIDRSYIDEKVIEIIKVPYYEMKATLYDKEFSVCCIVDSVEHMFLMDKTSFNVCDIKKEENEKFLKISLPLQIALLLSLVAQSILGFVSTIKLINFLNSSMNDKNLNYCSLTFCCLWLIINFILYICLEKYEQKNLSRIKIKQKEIERELFEEKKYRCKNYLINEGLDLPKEFEFDKFFNLEEENDED